MKPAPLPSLSRLFEVLEYFPETGALVWKKRISIRITVGRVACSEASKGYLKIGIDGKRYKAHRIAYFMGTGIEAKGDIDHIDGDRSNNRLSNLRDVSRAENIQNQRHANRDSKTGVLGVTRTKSRKYRAQIAKDGKNKSLGVFATAEAAHAAYVEAKRQIHKGGML